MTHRYALAAVLLAALSIPAAAQQTTQPDTSKKATPADTGKKAGTTVTTSPGSIAEPAKPNDSTTGVTTSPGASVTTPAPTTPATMTPSPATPNAGASVSAPAAQPTPMKSAAKVSIKVDSTLANSVKISADSAYALALAQEPGGKVSSADLEMKEGKLVYEIKLITSAQGASEVQVDAMTGAVVKDKKYGGIKASITHDQETKKLNDAKKDSVEAKKP